MKKKYNDYYWFAIGYYDGRTVGAYREYINHDSREYYNNVYDTGVGDYCREDIGEEYED